MKRILYLTFYFRPDLCAGSFRNSPLVDELAKQIEGTDIHVDVITTSPNRYATFRKDFEENEQLGNVSITRIVVPSHESGIKDQIFSFKTYFFEVLKRTRNRNYNLVFASSSRFFTSFLGYLVAKRNHTPLYLDIRDLFSETIKNVSTNPIIQHLVAPVIENREKKVYRYATHINLISEGFRDDFNEFYKANFSYFSHGVDPMFNISKKASTPENKTQKYIVYAGNIGESQELHKIIPEAAKKLEKEYLFRIIGDGGAKNKLLNRLKELNVTNVELADPVSRKKLIQEYKKADILFIHLNDSPSFKKVLPSKIFELAAMEKPILAGVDGYAKYFLENKVNGCFLFSPSNVNQLGYRIKEIEEFWKKNKKIDNQSFIKEYERKTIKKEMASSILSYLRITAEGKN